MKKIAAGIGILALIAGIAVFILVGNLDKIVKGGLETVGSNLLGVPVKVASVNIELKSGTGQISGLSIANPAGFPGANAFQMDTIRLGINIKSLSKQPLVINELIIQDPRVRLDVNNDGSSNLQKLMATMEENSKQDSTTANDETAVPKKESSKEMGKEDSLRFAFGTLSVTGVTVEVHQEGNGMEKVIIPDIVQQNIGGTAGLAPAEVGKLIVGNIIAGSLEKALKKKLSEKIEEAAGDFFNKIQGAFGSDKN